MPFKYRNYSKEALKNALNDVKLGLPLLTASKKYGVPRPTIHAKLKGIYPEECKSGKSTTLTAEEEDVLVKWIISLGKTGFPVTKEQLLDSVSLLMKKLKRNSNFKGGRPGRHWYEGFLKRHPELSLRMAQNLTSSRAAVSESKIRNWFNEIKTYFSDNNIQVYDPRRVFNADEAGFCLAPKGKQALVKKGSKAIYNFASANERESITTLVAGNAAGEFAPPMVIFAYDRIPKHIVMQFPDKWDLGKSENGWMTSESFFEYISNVFYPWLLENKVEFPVILYVDGHKSHITMEVSEFCSKKDIILISLVPNATHILQPMDVGVFHPLKTKWRNAISKWRLENKKQLLKRENFAPILKEGLENLDSQVILRNAFRVCGLFPFEADNVDYTKCLTSLDQNEQLTHKTAEVSYSKEDVSHHLRFLEKRIGIDKIEEFKKCFDGTIWRGEVEDTSLFDLWRTVVKENENRLEDNANQTSQENCNIEVALDDCIVLEGEWINDLVNENYTSKQNDNQQEPCDDTNIENIDDTIKELPEVELFETHADVTVEINHHLKDITNQQQEDAEITDNLKVASNQQEAIGESSTIELKDTQREENIFGSYSELPHQTPTKTIPATEGDKSDAPIVPSPFKSILFWPSATSSDKKKKAVREKVPSVCVSEKWKDYYRKKDEEKKRKEEEIQERKRKRQEASKLKNKDKKPRKQPKQCLQTIDQESEKLDTSQLKVGDFVIVSYNNQKYPGKITNIAKEGAVVNVMVNSGMNKWKWPTPPDELEYQFTDIVERILEPKAANNRNIFIVPEFEKYQNYQT